MMGFELRTPEVPQTDSALAETLAEELGRGLQGNAAALGSDPNAPDIIVEQTRLGKKHVTVIWDEWGHLPVANRGRVILDAYRAVAPDEIPDITIAMGLTRAEARRLGLA